ncbi:hypothetical protein DXA62_11665 [Coprobacillus sp. OF03-2AA]|nr:hypothetical protein DXA62_11665 [Coprobacillus sp. OF03-2AA]
MLEFQFNGYNLDLEKLEKGINIFIKNQKMTKKNTKVYLNANDKMAYFVEEKGTKKREEKMNFDSLMALEPVIEVRKKVADKKEL